ncbi:hypothetical protein J7E24_15080 [Hymenobacter sp. ISL-91]|uniref:hypothetical protein n=1 Tax=Hymenobacter sp. ISL-91 TaxID=2819151 RepID=UPI001BE83698|nr:hypothetical protein [Hymenobacter sp. ISL-91]MBT2559112.1 hypothetical protein [Hymenobacter sp. ISL-91]
MNPMLLLCLAAVALLGACTKEDAPQEDDHSLLIGKDWLRSGGTIPRNGTTQQEAKLSSCEQDDFLRFEEADRLLYDEGLSRCKPAVSQVLEGTWRLQQKDRLLILDIDNDLRGKHQITELTETNLSFRYSRAGKQYILTYTRR